MSVQPVFARSSGCGLAETGCLADRGWRFHYSRVSDAETGAPTSVLTAVGAGVLVIPPFATQSLPGVLVLIKV